MIRPPVFFLVLVLMLAAVWMMAGDMFDVFAYSAVGLSADLPAGPRPRLAYGDPPTPLPSPTLTATPTLTPTLTPTATPTPTLTPTLSPTATPTPTVDPVPHLVYLPLLRKLLQQAPSPTVLPTRATAERTPSPTPTETPTASPTPTETPPPSETVTPRSTATATPSATPTFTPSPTYSPSPVPTTAVPTSTPSPTPTEICGEAVGNGDFEQGPLAWVQEPANIITTLWGQPYQGTWVAWFGGYNDAEDQIYQQLHIPAGAQDTQVLSFYLYVNTEETGLTAYDHFFFQFFDLDWQPLSDPIHLADNTTVMDWTFMPIELGGFSDLAGQEIYVLFKGSTDYCYPTNFVMDVVSLDIVCGPGEGRSGEHPRIWVIER